MHRRRVLFGREKERAVLDRAIEAARTCRGGLVLVAGRLALARPRSSMPRWPSVRF